MDSEISTERLLLRKPSLDDVRKLFEIHSDPATNVFNPTGPHTSLEESQAMLGEWLELWEQHGFGYWSVTLKSEPKTVLGFGGVSLKEKAGESYLNLYFRFSPNAWGQGYATEMARAALNHGCTLGYDSITASVRPNNLASIKVLERLGLTRQGKTKDQYGYSYFYVWTCGSTN